MILVAYPFNSLCVEREREGESLDLVDRNTCVALEAIFISHSQVQVYELTGVRIRAIVGNFIKVSYLLTVKGFGCVRN